MITLLPDGTARKNPRLVPSVGETLFTGCAAKRRRTAKRIAAELEAAGLPIERRVLVQSVKSAEERFELYPRTIIHKRPQTTNPPKKRGTRKAIDHLSKRAQRGLRHAAVNAWPALVSQFCLTYHQNWPKDGRIVKKHLHCMIERLRYYRPDLRYLWILEFQERGAPHFHLFLSEEPNRELQQFLASAWVDITDPGNGQALNVHMHPKNFIKWDMGGGTYVAKYLEKQSQKQVPEGFENVGRFYGASRGAVPLPSTVRPADFEAAATDRITGEVQVTWQQCVRWLGKWHQAQLRAFAAVKGRVPGQSRFRHTPQSARLWTGVYAYLVIEQYAIEQRRKSECASVRTAGSEVAAFRIVRTAANK